MIIVDRKEDYRSRLFGHRDKTVDYIKANLGNQHKTKAKQDRKVGPFEFVQETKI